MVSGPHGECIANVPRAVVEAHSIEPEHAIAQHQAVVNSVLGPLMKQKLVIRKDVLVNIFNKLFTSIVSFVLFETHVY